MRVGPISGWFGCGHRRLSFPLTPKAKAGRPAPGTYVTCLECGREFEYDWSAMRIGGPVVARDGSRVYRSPRPLTRYTAKLPSQCPPS